MPPSFRSENPAERGDDSPLLPAPRPGRKEERTSGIGQKKESEKLRFGKFRGKAFTGKPEPLRGDLAGFWSRRINDKDRLVYRIDDANVYIIGCRFHYGDT